MRFRAVPPADVPVAMRDVVAEWTRCVEGCWVPPAIALAAFNLDFLCIHPFRDGNGRVSRLLLLLQCYQAGFDVGRYISVERLIETDKARYYETLEQASAGWHGSAHDPWPYINYVLYVLVAAYREFEARVGETRSPRGAKTNLVLAAIERVPEPFRVADIQHACPGVSVDMIRRVLKQEQRSRRVECLSRGPAASWRRRRSEGMQVSRRTYR